MFRYDVLTYATSSRYRFQYRPLTPVEIRISKAQLLSLPSLSHQRYFEDLLASRLISIEETLDNEVYFYQMPEHPQDRFRFVADVLPTTDVERLAKRMLSLPQSRRLLEYEIPASV